MKKQFIIFDFDGTLINTDPAIIASWQEVFRTYRGHECGLETIYRTFGETIKDTVARFFPDEDQEEVIRCYRAYQDAHCKELLSIFDGIPELLDELEARGRTVAIVTSRLAKTTAEYLDLFHLRDRFKVIITADDTKAHKPDPEPLLMALEKLGARREEAVMLGDTRFDIGCCKNAGVDSVLVHWGHPSTGDEGEPTWHIHRPEELLTLID